MSSTVHFIPVTVSPIKATFSLIAGTFTHELARARHKSDTFRLSLGGTVASA